ncbi:MAG: hypothetical protein GY807_07895 [Gammaproteobacteria bacterium]|nr:hypothetical protein [Gammaproteobacteria bacterium]
MQAHVFAQAESETETRLPDFLKDEFDVDRFHHLFTPGATIRALRADRGLDMILGACRT